jgi:hypothetical protein
MRLCHFIPSQYALLAIRHQRLKVAQVQDLNDPFEFLCSDMPDPQSRRDFSSFKIWAAKRYGILCFTKAWRNPMMWGHYADRHKGVVLEFEADEEAIVRVAYAKERVTFDLAKLIGNEQFSLNDAEVIFATKSHHWRYEREVRAPIDLRKCVREGDFFFYPFDAKLELKGVITGHRCGLTENDILAHLPEGKQLLMRRARLAFRSFNVVRQRAIKPRVLGNAQGHAGAHA